VDLLAARANRQAKPLSSGYNFGCAKLFIGMDREKRVFQFGLQVERGYLASSAYEGNTLQKDWDWHRLVRACGRAARWRRSWPG